MEGYRLRSSHGDVIDPRQPLPVDSIEGQESVSQSETLTYNGKATSGAVTINATSIHPIVTIEGDQVGGFWERDENKVYSALISPQAQNKGEKNWVNSLVETDGSAAVSIYDNVLNLENTFESVAGTVKRFILKATDNEGEILYGWILGVAVTADVYTLDIVSNRLTETQNWYQGGATAFDPTIVREVEIYRYDSSLVFGTGTQLIEEVACPKEYSKNWENPVQLAEKKLTNGQYFVDYMRGRIIGKKADATASETVTYNVLSSLASGGTTVTANVNIDKFGGTAVTLGQKTSSASIPVTIASDQDVGTSGDTADDAVDAGNPVGIGGLALSAQRAAVASGDRVKAVFNLFGELVVAGYDWAANAIRTKEIDPISQHFVGETLLDLTNIAETTTAYAYLDMAGYRGFSIQGETSGATPTDVLTVTIEGTNQDDGTAPASCAYQDVTNALFGVASWVDTDFFAVADTLQSFKYIRVKYTTSTGGGNDCDLTVYSKKTY